MKDKPQIPFKELLQKAEEIYFSHSETRYISAISAFKEVIAINPNHIESYGMLATMYKCVGDFDNALKTYDMALEINHKSIQTLNLKVTTLLKIHRMNYSPPYYVDTYNVEFPYYKINYRNSQNEMRIILLEEIEKLLSLQNNFDENYELKLRKAEVLEKLNYLGLAVDAYLECLKNIPERKFKSYFHPIESHKKSISRLYQNNNQFERALKFYNEATKGKKIDYTHRNKIVLFKENNQLQEAESILNQIIESIKKSFIAKPESTYISQLFELGYDNQKEDVIEYSITMFDKLEPLSERTKELKEKLLNKLANKTTSNSLKTIDQIYKIKKLSSEKKQLQNYKNQWSNEFISWNYDLGTHYSTTKLLDGINWIIKNIESIEFPIAEYYSKNDIYGLLGASFGEILKNNFGWSWNFAQDIEKGIVGLIIISPDNKIGILTDEYMKQRYYDTERDDLLLYNHLKSGSKISTNNQCSILGDWINKTSFQDIK